MTDSTNELSTAVQAAISEATYAAGIIADAVARDRIPAALRIAAVADVQRIAARLNKVATKLEKADVLGDLPAHKLPVVPGCDSGLYGKGPEHFQ